LDEKKHCLNKNSQKTATISFNRSDSFKISIQSVGKKPISKFNNSDSFEILFRFQSVDFANHDKKLSAALLIILPSI